MKLAYKCEYCDKMGDETTIKEHEEECIYNPENHTCYSCKHARICEQCNHCVCTKNGQQTLLSVFITHSENDCWEQGTPNPIIGV